MLSSVVDSLCGFNLVRVSDLQGHRKLCLHTQVAHCYDFPAGIVKGPVQSKSMFISIDQLPKMIEFHTIIVHKYSSVDFILIFFDMLAAILKKEKFF